VFNRDLAVTFTAAEPAAFFASKVPNFSEKNGMNEVITREALQILFYGETLYAVPERVGQGAGGVELPDPDASTPKEVLVSAVTEASKPDVELPPAAPATVPLPPALSPLLPAYRQTILLTDRPSPDDLDFLSNILKAVSLTLDDVDLLDLQKMKGQDFKPLLENKSAHQFISFGVGLKKLNLDLVLVPYRITPVEGIQFLLTDPLAVIQTDKAKKKALWINLQVLFGLG